MKILLETCSVDIDQSGITKGQRINRVILSLDLVGHTSISFFQKAGARLAFIVDTMFFFGGVGVVFLQYYCFSRKRG